MILYKNVASQKLPIYAYVLATGAPVTGHASDITCQISKDYGSHAATGTAHPTELDSTNLPGWYYFPLTQAETNCDCLIASPVDGNVSPAIIQPVKIETLKVTANGNLLASLQEVLTTAVTAQMSAAWVKFFNVATSVLTTASVNQGADSNVILSNGTYGLSALHTEVAKDATVSKPGTAQTIDLTITTPDGITISYALELLAALVNGKYALNTPSTGQITFYKRNSTSVLSVVAVAAANRTRVS
jgi:hypothetical protein